MTTADTEPVDLAAIAEHLAVRHPHLPRAMIELEVTDAARSFDEAVVRGYLGVLIERQARARLLGDRPD